MKQKKLLYARACALPAIAAALALTSTPLLAQEAQPVTATPPTTTTTEPAPTPEVAPTTTETTTTTTDEPATEAAPVAKRTTTTVKRTSRTTAAKPATTSTRTTTTRTVARAATPAPAPTAAAPAAPTPATQPAPPQSAVAPVVDMNAKPPTAPAAKPAKADNTLPMLGGIALVLIALGAAVALMARRRRRRDEEAWVYDEPAAEPVATEPVAAVEPEPVIHEEQPAIVAPSAFAWGEKASQPRADQTVDEDDRMPGETWIQRAYRGPTPNNPSVSLKARLKRAAFFDKRERDVAAGKAEPVDMGAGLPDAVLEEERETA